MEEAGREGGSEPLVAGREWLLLLLARLLRLERAELGCGSGLAEFGGGGGGAAAADAVALDSFVFEEVESVDLLVRSCEDTKVHERHVGGEGGIDDEQTKVFLRPFMTGTRPRVMGLLGHRRAVQTKGRNENNERNSEESDQAVGQWEVERDGGRC